jgi:hypothetical protein
MTETATITDEEVGLKHELALQGVFSNEYHHQEAGSDIMRQFLKFGW